MYDIKDNLLSTNLFECNIYFYKYIDMINNNKNTVKIKGVTQNHHIIPKSFYRYINKPVDNSSDNIVTLLYKDHIIAHCLLYLCLRENILKYKMFCALNHILGNKRLSKDAVINLLRDDFCYYQKVYENSSKICCQFNPMRNYEHKRKHDIIMQSEKVRKSISDTIKLRISQGYLFDDEHKQHLKESAKNRVSSNNCNISRSGYVGGVTGLKMIYDTEGNRRYKSPDLIEELLSLGWTLPENKKKGNVTNTTKQKHIYKRHINEKELTHKLSVSHSGQIPWNKGKNMDISTKQKLSMQFKGRKWMNNGYKQKQVIPEDIQSYLENGYIFGRLKGR